MCDSLNRGAMIEVKQGIRMLRKLAIINTVLMVAGITMVVFSSFVMGLNYLDVSDRPLLEGRYNVVLWTGIGSIILGLAAGLLVRERCGRP